MMMKNSIGILVACAAIVCLCKTTFAADRGADQAAVEKAIQSYTAAFNAGDAKSPAVHWSPDAIYINPIPGNQVEARVAIAKEFELTLSQMKGMKLIVNVESIRFIVLTMSIKPSSSGESFRLFRRHYSVMGG